MWTGVKGFEFGFGIVVGLEGGVGVGVEEEGLVEETVGSGKE